MYNYNKYATDGSKATYSSSLSFRPPAHTQMNNTVKENTPSTIASTALSERVTPANHSSLAPQAMPSPSSQLLSTPQVPESRKRLKDIRGIDRFRQVVYGENGFRRLHAMVCREPVLMYPPSGVAEARSKVQDALHAAKQVWLEKARKSRQRRYRNHSEQQQEEEEKELREWEQEQYEEELSMLTDAELLQIFTEHVSSANKENELSSATIDDCQNINESHTYKNVKLTPNDIELSKYHHKQLDAFIRLIYEFNQATFTKLPLSDTLQMLSRCGKEAVAHVMEYETHVRLAQEKRRREITALHAEDEALRRRTLDVELRRTELELAEAENVEKEQEEEEQHEEEEEQQLQLVNLSNSDYSTNIDNIEYNTENTDTVIDSTIKD